MDQNIFIPMRGMVQSLNVSVAASTLLFEALRQREMADFRNKYIGFIDYRNSL